MGGISDPPRQSLNLALKTDDPVNVISENWKRFLSAISLSDYPVFYGKQTHKTVVKKVTSANVDKAVSFHDYHLVKGLYCVGECDGLWTDEPGVALSVFTADCLPAFLIGQGEHPFVAALHCGWRGLAAGIIGKALSVISAHISFLPEDVTLLAGPHIGSCCFETKDDVADVFSEINCKSVKPSKDFVGKFFVDLGMIVESSAKDLGISASQVHVCDLCTCCNESRFYSYRRAKTADRGSISSVIMMK